MTDHSEPSNLPPEPEWEALARFTSGESPASERSAFEQRIARDAAQARLVGVLSEIGRGPEPVAPSAAETEMALRAVLSRRGEMAVSRTPVVSLATYRSKRWNTALQAAAAIIAILGTGLVYRSRQAAAPLSTQTVAHSTTTGRFTRFDLPDGTKVLLGPASSLDVGAGYGGTARQVALTGQARFEVVHDDARPFTVNTSSATFRDIGTVFSINSDAGTSRLVVSQGLVAARGKGDSSFVTLGAGDRAVASSNRPLKVERAVNVADDEAWTSGRLVYHDAPVSDVVSDIRRWYGRELVVDPVFAGRVITATFDPGTTASDAGRVIAAALGGGVREEDQTLRIVPAPAAKSSR